MGTTTARSDDMTTQTPDTGKAADFSERVLGILNGGALALMISIGHRAGLFDVMERLEFATSAQIAVEAGLHERYVREWLGAMATGAIVDYDPARDAYRLPAEHAAVLARSAGRSNLAITTQWISLLGSVEDSVLDCFQHGGGVPYSAFERFQQVMAEESDQTVVAALHDAILPLVPDRVAKLRAGADVLDVGCGSGRALNELAASFPASRFAGYDLSPAAIQSARVEARERGLGNVVFEVRDVADLRAEAAYDLVTAFDAIHDQARHPPRPRGRGDSLRAAALHRLLPALHDGLAGRGRRGTRRDVGRGDGAPHARRRRLRGRGAAHAPTRPAERLLHRPEDGLR
jgi:SAM-dependent methyltransferase